MHVLTHAYQVLAQLAQAFGCVGSTFHASGVDSEPRKPLRQVVMQFACEVSALVFVRGQQTAGELLDLSVADLEKRLEKPAPVFVSPNGNAVADAYLKLLDKDAIVIVIQQTKDKK